MQTLVDVLEFPWQDTPYNRSADLARAVVNRNVKAVEGVLNDPMFTAKDCPGCYVLGLMVARKLKLQNIEDAITDKGYDYIDFEEEPPELCTQLIAENQLTVACICNDWDCVAQLLNSGRDTSILRSDGSPLIFGCEFASDDIISLLLSQPDDGTKEDQTMQFEEAFTVAIHYQRVNVIWMLFNDSRMQATPRAKRAGQVGNLANLLINDDLIGHAMNIGRQENVTELDAAKSKIKELEKALLVATRRQQYLENLIEEAIGGYMQT